mgnify:CR=1 FL=1
MDHSVCLYQLAAFLKRNGVEVDLWCKDLPAQVAGSYTSHDRKIRLSPETIGPSAKHTLITLAHEAGHWLGYVIDPMPKQYRYQRYFGNFVSYQRERQAFVYGWRFLRVLDADVTREEWIQEHRQ